MKFLVFLAVAVACAAADVTPYKYTDESQAPIVKSNFESSPDNYQYQYGYETGNGIVAESSGIVKNPETNNPTLSAQGFFKYYSPEGTPVETSWVADENGYVAQGSHIPVAPPVPEAIARALAYIASHPPAVEKSLLG